MSYPGQPHPLTPEEQAYLQQNMTPEEANPCLWLPKLRTAYYHLMGGHARAHVQFQHRVTTYHRGDVKELQAEISRLTILCDPDNQRGRAVRAGPSAPNGSFGLRRGPYPYR